MPEDASMKVNMKFLMLIMFIAFAPSLGHADAKAGEKKAQLCLLCHKPNNLTASVPTLEGQTREYLYNQIKAYKEKRRPDPAMQTNVARLSEQDMRDLADYFSSQKPVRASAQLDTAKIAKGKSKTESLNCGTCHMPDFSGKKEVPRLAGMDARYVALQLVAFGSGKRPHPQVDGLNGISGDDAEDLAQYFAHLE
jgi:cytochrome c553